MKRFSFLLIALVSLLSITNVKAHDFEVDGIYYNIINKNNLTVAVTFQGTYYSSYNEYIGKVEIPSSVTYNEQTYSVISISMYAFKDCKDLTGISIPGTIKSIGYSAFMNCTSLVDVAIANGLEIIDSQAFYGCKKILNCNIPYGVTKIGDYAFQNCNKLINAEIPSTVTEIGSYAFRYCESITNIKIPDSVVAIKDYTFYGCKNLETVEMSENITGIREGAFGNCKALKNIKIPNNVTGIGVHAFSYCSALQDVVLGDNVTNIGTFAFYNCENLQSVTLGENVTSIGDRVFDDCEKLKIVINNSSLKISKGSRTYGYVAYYAKAVISKDNSHEYTKIEDCYFHKTDTTQILVAYVGSDSILQLPMTYDNSCYSISDSAFYKCSNLDCITIPNCINDIGVDAFLDCSGLTAVHILDMHSWCTIDFSSETSNPLYYAKNLYLNNVLLREIIIPKGISVIKPNAFVNCSNITLVEIPETINAIGDNAFYGCRKDTIINFSYLIIENSSSYGYIGRYAYKIINAPNGEYVDDKFIFYSSDDMHHLAGYIGDEQQVVLPNNYKEGDYIIMNDAFKDNAHIKYVEVPNSVTSICENAFYGCSNLKTVVNFSHLKFESNSSYGCIGRYANRIINAPDGEMVDNKFVFCSFNDKYYLLGCIIDEANLILPDNYKENDYIIGERAFYNCDWLYSLIMSNGITNIEKESFYGCRALKYVSFGTKVEEIGDYAFYNCISLENVETPNSLTKLGNYTFGYCNALTNIFLSDNLTSVGDYSFYKCTSLNQIEFPSNVTTIGECAFYDCKGLLNIIFGDGIINVGRDSFYGCLNLEKVCISDIGNWCNIEFKSLYSNPLYYTDNLYLNNELVTQLFVPELVTDIKKYTFCNCNKIKNIILPNGLETIGSNAFNSCRGLTEVRLPNNLSSIGSNAFAGCVSLNKVEFGLGVTNIGSGAFGDCTELKEIFVNNIETWCNIDFENVYSNPLYYAKQLYLNGELIKELVIPENVVEIKDYVFYNCNSLERVEIANSVLDVGNKSFYGCTGINNITILDGVKTIGQSAFSGCINVETLYISNTIESIGDYAFAGCDNLLELKVGAKKAVAASDNVFSVDAYNNACLYVPEGRKFAYEKTAPWNRFYIAEMDFTGVENIKGVDENLNTIYDLYGRKVEEIAIPGVYIINNKKFIVK